MNLITDFYGYGYLPTVLFLLNTAVICIKFSEKYSRKDYIIYAAILTAGLIMSIFVISLIPWNNFYDLWAQPSLSEGVMNFCSIAGFTFMLDAATVKRHSKNTLFIFSGLSLLMFFSKIIYPLMFDVAEIVFFVLMIKKSSSKIKFAAIFMFMTVLCWYFVRNFSWSFIHYDIRPDKLTFVKEDRGFDDYKTHNYVFGCVNDSGHRLKMVFNEIDSINEYIEFVFLEDTIPAFSFLRSTIRVSPLGGDPLGYSAAALTIYRKNGHFFKPIEYKTPQNIDFKIVSQTDTTIIFSADFCEMNFKILCGFQNFLTNCNIEYFNKNLIIRNKKSMSKAKLFYYDKDFYDVEIQ